MSTKKKQQSALDFADQLESFVIFNSDAVIEEEGPDWIRVRIRLILKGFSKFMSHFFKVRDYRKYVLTGYNFILFNKIRQNKITVRELIHFLADREKLSFLEARAFILSFAALLMQRGIIAVEVPKAHGSPPPDLTVSR